MTFWGVVCGGLGRASRVAAALPADVWSPLGYVPYPGTLNLLLGFEGRRWVRGLPCTDVGLPLLPGPYYELTVGGVPGHGRFSRWYKGVEVVAPVRLRDALGLIDGDRVRLTAR